MSFLDRIRDCNNHQPARYRVFRINGVIAGRMTHEFAEQLAQWSEVFDVRSDEVLLNPKLLEDNCALWQRSLAVAEVVCELRARGAIEGWRDEIHKVAPRWSDPPLLRIERAAVPYFGAGGFAVHVNGYVRRGDDVLLWVGRRSKNKPNAPGKLDHLVAGGQPADLGLLENVIKECEEEAGIPAELAARARSSGFVSYAFDTVRGHRPDTVFTYDLELPRDFEPVNTDGEVDEFYLWSLDEVAERVRDTRDFKYNCSLVIIDFLVRHGYLDAEHPEYCDIVTELRGARSVV